jgi:hypothetical protein
MVVLGDCGILLNELTQLRKGLRKLVILTQLQNPAILALLAVDGFGIDLDSYYVALNSHHRTVKTEGIEVSEAGGVFAKQFSFGKETI